MRPRLPFSSLVAVYVLVATLGWGTFGGERIAAQLQPEDGALTTRDVIGATDPVVQEMRPSRSAVGRPRGMRLVAQAPSGPRDGTPNGQSPVDDPDLPAGVGIPEVPELSVGGGPLQRSAEAEGRDVPLRADQPIAMGMAVVAGGRRYVPGQWSVVRSNVINPTEELVDLQISSYLGSDPTLQFSRKFSLPPLSRRSVWYPLRIPDDVDPEAESITVGTLLEPADGGAPLQTDRDGHLRLHQRRAVTGVLSDVRNNSSGKDWVAEGVRAVRSSQQLPIELALLDARYLPPTEKSFAALDQLVLASSKLSERTDLLRAIRSWVFQGGRLWIMADQCDDDLLSQLLGARVPASVVDRVDLTDVQFNNALKPGEPPSERVAFEEPLAMVRMFVHDAEVGYTVNDWPAVLRSSLGRGTVHVTTLDVRGMLRIRRPNDPMPRSRLLRTDYYPQDPLAELAVDLLSAETNDELPEEELSAYLSEQIGYRTVPRLVLTIILGGFCASMLAGAVWFARTERAEWSAVTAGVTALIASLAILGLGWFNRRAVPPSVASLQLVEVLPNSQELSVDGRLAVYNSTPVDASLAAEGDGVVWPDLQGLEGSRRRVTFTDFDRNEWEDLRLPPGVRRARTRMTVAQAEPVLAAARFVGDHLEGTLKCEGYADVRDALLVTPSGRRMAVRFGKDGTFTIANDAMLSRGQFTGDSLLDDQQRRHRDLYAALLSSKSAGSFIQRPSLLAWATPSPLSWQRPPETQYLGSALLVLPLHLEQPPVDTPLVIPAPLLKMASVMGPVGQSLSSSYNNRSRQWLTQSAPGQIHLRFQVPDVVRPFRIDEARLNVAMECPTRRVDVVGFEGAKTIGLQRLEGPGRFTCVIDEPRALSLDASGGLLLGIYIDQVLQAEGRATNRASDSDVEWVVEDVNLVLSGRRIQTKP